MEQENMMNELDFQLFESILNQRLTRSLPGTLAHEKMVPPTRKASLLNPIPLKNVKLSAVLMLLYPNYDALNFALIKRADYNGVHSDQIALPGGQYENSDDDLEFTALRESQEEVGIDIKKVRISGRLSEIYIPPSNFRVQPYVGFYPEKPVFQVDGVETTRVIEVAITDFINPDLQVEESIISREGKEVKVPCFYLNGEIVWGATAMILSEFLMVLNEISVNQSISFR